MFEFDFAARVDRGLVRETNQDVARVIPRLGLALVADGMGGHDHGDVASRTAADVFEQSFTELGGPGANVRETLERLERSVQEANQYVGQHPATGAGPGRMGTTLVAAVFAHGHAVIGNVGDSRCYLLRYGKLEQLTLDHTLAAHLEQMGGGGPPQGGVPLDQWAHVLTRCLNGDDGVTADTRVVRCEPGDVFLLCSDGLWGSASEHVVMGILGAAQDAEEACQRLVGAACAAGGADNIGVAVARLVPLALHLSDPSWQSTRPSDPPLAT